MDRYPDPEAFSVGVMYERLGKRLELEDITDTWGYDRMVVSPDISRPGLCLSGYTYKFMHDRIQIFGETEITLLKKLSPQEKQAAVKNVFNFPVVCSIITKGLTPPDELVSASQSSGSALFVSPQDTTPLIHDLTDFLSEVFAPHVSLHGTLVDVYGEGLLVMGRSAIGKSEAVLGLVERGHRLVADDLVRVRKTGNRLIGSGDAMLGFHMEIRGIGFVNIAELFGVGAIKEMQSVDLVVRLFDTDLDDEADRSGLIGKHMSIMGVDVPMVEIPVLPGRNITLLLEVAAMMNIQVKDTGSTSAERLNRKLIARMGRKRLRE
ncbi:HPr(Ser) kinase/phosphatase [Candidatus Fermentibacteria bacterium]|nr:MAG: HPr(Ser) kinase/phosphatase [Candidatus Fermentibacteria bacterium]